MFALCLKYTDQYAPREFPLLLERLGTDIDHSSTASWVKSDQILSILAWHVIKDITTAMMLGPLLLS